MAPRPTAWQPVQVSDLDRVRELFLAVNGAHPMTAADDAYVREHFVEASPTSVQLMLAGQASLPAYLLSDGTPMVPKDHLKMVEITGDAALVADWFRSCWPDDPEHAQREWERHLTGRRVDLTDSDGVAVMRAERVIAQASAALDVLIRDPRDDLGRASLWEALFGSVGVRGLDTLLRPMTAYDRLRFDEEPPRQRWVDRLSERWFSPAPAPTPIHTDRLVLRPPRPTDSATLAAAYADPAFVEGLLTPPHIRPETDAMSWWRSQPDDGPHRALPLVIEREGRVVGDLIIMLQEVGLLTAELGWTLVPWEGGQGFAVEAAQAAMATAFTHYGVRRVRASLDADNARSAALAERLGMSLEVFRVEDFWSKGRFTSTYEYAITREEWLARTTQ